MNEQQQVAIGIAIASLIVVPILAAFGRRLWVAWKEHRDARLHKLFVPREELKEQWEELTRTQATQHGENRQILEALRTEGQNREQRLLTAIAESRKEVGTVHGRVDRLFELVLTGKKP